jgi:phospholipid/cholesterol/gamma-HCH transport system substrate-binding protein
VSRRGTDVVLVGTWVLVTGAILVGALLWLAGANVFRRVERYEVVFDRSVSGLTPGASVEFQGVNVGRVDALRLTDEIPPRVSVRIDVEPGTPVRRDTHAFLLGSLVTGIKWIALQGGTEEAGQLEASGIIPGDISSFDALGDQVVEIGNRVLQITDRLANEVFTADNNAKLSAFMNDIASLTDSLRTTIEPIREQETGKEITKLVKHFTRAADNLDHLIAELNAEEGGVIDSSRRTLRRLEEAAVEMRDLMRVTRLELIGAGSSAATLIADLTSATNRLEETLDVIQSDPSLLLRGGPASEGD